jgi:hypothetical protein
MTRSPSWRANVGQARPAHEAAASQRVRERLFVVAGRAVPPLSALLLAGCTAEYSFYAGHASFQTRGEAAQLKDHVVDFVSCEVPQGRTTDLIDQPPVVHDGFTLLEIGRTCTLHGVGSEAGFVADTGGLCTLTFDGNRTLRVADVKIRHNTYVAEEGHERVQLDLQISGSDATTGAPTIYRFRGDSLSTYGLGVPRLCEAQRIMHAQRERERSSALTYGAPR